MDFKKIGDWNDLVAVETTFGLNLEQKKIFVTGELNEAIGQDLRLKQNIIKQYWEYIKEQECKEVTLDVCSFGGMIYSTNAVLDFYDEMATKNIIVNSHTSSVCMSAATIFVCGAPGKRTASKRAKFMLHDLQISGMSGTAEQIKHETLLLQQEQEEMFALYVEFANRNTDTKKSPKEVKKWIKKYCGENLDHYLSSSEMLKLNLIDEIV